MVISQRKKSSRMNSRGLRQNSFKTPSYYAGSRKKKSFSFNWVYFKYLLAVFILIYLLYFLFLSNHFGVKEIIVEGNSLLSSEELVNSFPQGKNIFLIRTNKLKQAYLNNYKEISNISIYRGIPSSIKIVIIERTPEMVWQSGDKKYLVSSEGCVMREISDPARYGDLPIVTDKKSLRVNMGDRLVSASFITFIQNVYHNLYKEANIKPTAFEIFETTFDVSVLTDAGFYIKLDSLRSSKKQIDNLKLVLIEKKADIHEYVDLRIDGWAYYK